ncbi:flagellar basal body-associated FliL family protein [Candidatus Raskinella chloraquaticus]|uniref:Flagellar protein FliL n=1 Tax=Candidatus Raskinella chloraquaticus TaxID=1951219 RepID=A0A1W9I1K8_9HYPH|nr:MAG: hypothetical protein A4S15_04910 [Proteobacteria bacterium SG_bin8]
MAKKAKDKDAEKPADGAAAAGGKFAFLKNKKLMIMAGGGGVLALALIGGGLWFSGIIGGKAAPKDEDAGQEVAAAPAAGGHGAKPAAGGHGAPAPAAAPAGGGHGAKPAAPVSKDGASFFDLPELTVNLTTSGQRPQYLRLKLALEMGTGQANAQLEPLVPRVLDSFQVFLRDLRPADLEGSAAVHRLKEELMRRVNLAAQPVRIDAVLLREILVQ